MIVGLDMGGTHVDAVIIENKKIIKSIKKPTNRDDLFNSIWTTLDELLLGHNPSKIKRINLSTTISTNAIVESKISKVGMMIQSGPGLSQDFLTCGDETVFLSGSTDHRGRIVSDLNHIEIKKGIQLFQQKNIHACAVITKFSTRNPSHELEIKQILEKNFSTITMGHSLSGKLNFPRRVFTSYLNEAVRHTFYDFSTNIQKSIKDKKIDAPIFILKADGGTMSLSAAENQPVETILSGPAASLMGMKALCPTNKDALLLDIGGTTTDIFFLAQGEPLLEPIGIQIGPYKTLVRATYSASIGIGGDSCITVENGKLKIGPKREGIPYAFGGPKPTPTDAMILLGFIEGNQEKALDAMNLLASSLKQSPEQLAYKILDIMGDQIKKQVDQTLQKINSKPVYTVKDFLYLEKIEPKQIYMIGGPAKVLSPIIENKFHLPCTYPENYDIANAIGAALAKPTTEITLLADTSEGFLSVPELGIYEDIGNHYTLDMAKKRAFELLKESALLLGAQEDEIEPEMIEENSFPMVRGFSTSGQNIRLKVQMKPTLLHSI
ncbi:MAG: hydantoinase/oxoprolinase family protein [Epulopiscium sp.]|nr:hydantoinase/oxoprolinase family protein [Candidatus Epulonipiscium sp.]